MASSRASAALRLASLSTSNTSSLVAKRSLTPAVSQLVTASGASMIILSASKGHQVSEEDAGSGGGRFSVTIDNILTKRRSAFDLDGNGAISVAELYRGLKAQVVRDSEGRQTPWLSRILMVGDFDIF